jgi:hypothetical protein
MDLALFGPSGRWAAYLNFDPRIAYVGGSEAFMEVFPREAAGGTRKLQQRLMQVVDETEEPEELKDICGVLAVIGWDEQVMRGKHPEGREI